MSFWIILQKRSPAATIAWILVLAFLPVVGIPVYVFLGPRRLRRKQLRHLDARATVSQAVAPDAQAKLPVSPTALAGVELNQLVHLAEQTALDAPTRAEEAVVYDGGADTYGALETAFEAATHHIHLEYYIWEPDRTGTRLRDALVKRAAAGVEVRVLIDAIGSARAGDAFWAPLVNAGGEVARFNPAIGGRSWRPRLVNFRTHRKIVVCDGVVGFTGGINVSDVHSTETHGERAWRDTHLKIRGAAVRGLQLLFLEDWHFATGGAPTTDSHCPNVLPKGDYLVQVLGSGPDEQLNPIHKVYFASIAAARNRVLLTTPYFVPDEAINLALITAGLRGVDVRILVPKPQLNDLKLVAAASRSYYERLIRAGVSIYEYLPTMLHAKTLVMDDQVSMIGTANMDNRSFKLNFEDSCLVYGAEVAGRLAGLFEEDCKHARRVSLADATQLPLPTRILDSSARLLSPLL